MFLYVVEKNHIWWSGFLGGAWAQVAKNIRWASARKRYPEIPDVSGIIAKSLYFIVFWRHQIICGVFWWLCKFCGNSKASEILAFSCVLLVPFSFMWMAAGRGNGN